MAGPALTPRLPRRRSERCAHPAAARAASAGPAPAEPTFLCRQAGLPGPAPGGEAGADVRVGERGGREAEGGGGGGGGGRENTARGASEESKIQYKEGEVQNDDHSSPFRIAAGPVFKFTAQCDSRAQPGQECRSGPEDPAAAAVSLPTQNIFGKYNK